VVAVPTVREADGLAMSSRNRFLSPADRALAPVLHGVLQQVAAGLAQGAATAVDEGTATLTQAGFGVDYLALVDGRSMKPIDAAQDGARLITVARLGSVRLLDNVPVAAPAVR
jgi:pantoate--beta-alanine ligase